jgi:tRNA1(Val) A37 N6-methylase TrmN6
MLGTTPQPWTDDVFLGDRLKIRQPVRGYRAGADAVLLAATVIAAEGAPLEVLDVGSGAGVIGLCVAARLPGARVALLEREAELAELAHFNTAANAFQDRVRPVRASITEPLSGDARAALPADSFTHVLANPPFHDEHRGTPASSALKAASHAMAEGDLDAWVKFMARMTAPHGTATLIHKAEALPAVLETFGARFGGMIVKPIQARRDGPAIRIIVCGRKGSRAPLVLQRPFILHDEGNSFTREANAILRHGASLEL